MIVTKYIALELMAMILINCLAVVLIGSAFVIVCVLKEWFEIDLIEVFKKVKQKYDRK